MEDKFKQLEKAKNNIRTLLDNARGNIDFHGLVYWAEVVEKLRKEISENL